MRCPVSSQPLLTVLTCATFFQDELMIVVASIQLASYIPKPHKLMMERMKGTDVQV